MSSVYIELETSKKTIAHLMEIIASLRFELELSHKEKPNGVLILITLI